MSTTTRLENHRIVRLLLVLLAGATLVVWSFVFSTTSEAGEDYLKVTVFDVGQGDAIFIETPGGRQILIDGGPDNTVLQRLGEEMPFYDRDIDLVILTHPDRDHISGIVEVLKRYEVRMVLDNGIPKDDEVYAAYRDLIREKNIPHYTVKEGTRVGLGEAIQLVTLHPGGKAYDETNNNSIVLRLDFGEDSFLFTGDIEKGAEFEMIQDGANLDVDVLKVAHHGSKTSTTKFFLEKASPEIAVISMRRDNRYGHPHASILESLRKYGIKTLRTDIEGNITLVTEGEGVTILEGARF